MDPRDFFRGIFGFPNRPGFENGGQGYSDERDVPGASEDDDDDELPFNNNTFQVFTNPLEMERFFNHQMESMLKNFGISDGFFSFPLTPSLPERPESWEIPGRHDEAIEPGSRDFMLKKGILPPTGKGDPRRDDVIDKVDTKDLDDLFDAQPQPGQVQPRGRHFGGLGQPFMFPGMGPFNNGPHEGEDVPNNFGVSTFSFGRSMTQSRIRLPDGTVEERRTERDSNGNETTTVTKTVNGQTTTTVTKSDGSQQQRFDVQPFFNDGLAGGLFSRFFDPTPKNDSPPSLRNEMLKPLPESEQKTYKEIFSKLFGK